MDQNEKNTIISRELDALMPKGLSDEEQGMWRMCFNALRLADFATAYPSEGEIIAMFATIQTIFAGHCTSMSGPVLDSQKKIIVITCSNPNSDTDAMLNAKKELFPLWTFVVNSNQAPSGIYDKIDFIKKR